MKQSTVILILTIALIVQGCHESNKPVSVWQVNQHYFYYCDKPVLFITSDHHYGAVIDMDFDYVKYIDYLNSFGMNLTRIYPGGMFEPPDKYGIGNPLGPTPGRQLLPWKKTSQSGADPLLAEKGKASYKFDLDQWNPEYFKRLKAYVSLAREKGIVVEVAFFNGMYADCWPLMAMYHGNNIQGIGRYEAEDCGLFTTNDKRNLEVLKYQEAYVRKITTELNKFDNVIYDICDEPSLQGLPDGSITVLPDSLVSPWIIALKNAFLEAERTLPNKHLLGQTVQNLSPDFSAEEWCQWLPAEYVKTAENALKLDYKYNKPLVNVESNYYGFSLTKNPYTPESVRLEGWWFIMGGGAGSINLNGELFRGKESGGTVTQSQIALQRKSLMEFVTRLDLSELHRFEGAKCSSSGTLVHSLANEGYQYAVYLFHGSYEGAWGAHFIADTRSYKDTLEIAAVPSGDYKFEWIDPATDLMINSGTIQWLGGNLCLSSPEYKLDIALSLSRE